MLRNGFSRRQFFERSLGAAAGLGAATLACNRRVQKKESEESLFDISLAE